MEAFAKGKTPRTNGESILEGSTALLAGIIVAVVLSLALMGATVAHVRQALKGGASGVVEQGADTEQSSGPELQHLNPSSGQNSISYDTLPGSSKVNGGKKGSNRQEMTGAPSNQTDVPRGPASREETGENELSRRNSV